MTSDQRGEVLRLVAAGALRPDEALALLDLPPAARTVELDVRQTNEGRAVLRVVLPYQLVEAAAAAGLRVGLRVGDPPLAVTWQELAAQFRAQGSAEAVDQQAGVVVRLRGAQGRA